MASGAGGLYPRALCGRTWLYSLRHCSINIFASVNVMNISRLSNSSVSFPLNDSIYPFSHGLLGSMNNVFTLSWLSQFLTALAVPALSFLVMPHYGIIGIGYVWLGVQLVVSIALACRLLMRLSQLTITKESVPEDVDNFWYSKIFKACSRKNTLIPRFFLLTTKWVAVAREVPGHGCYLT